MTDRPSANAADAALPPSAADASAPQGFAVQGPSAAAPMPTGPSLAALVMDGGTLPSASVPERPDGRPGGWTDGLDPALREVAAAKGWQTPADAVRSYASLERLLGAEKVALPPANAPDADWDAVWDRLGRPRTPAGYQFEKPAGDDSYSDELASWAREACHKVGMPARMAEAFHDEFVSFARSMADRNETAQAMNDVELHAFMDREWGSARDDKLAAFRRGAHAFLDSPLSLDLVQKIMGTPETLRMFVRIGEWLGEDRAVGTGQRSFRLSREEAEQEFARIRTAAIADPKHPLMDKLHPEHPRLVERVEMLMRTIYPE